MHIRALHGNFADAENAEIQETREDLKRTVAGYRLGSEDAVDRSTNVQEPSLKQLYLRLLELERENEKLKANVCDLQAQLAQKESAAVEWMDDGYVARAVGMGSAQESQVTAGPRVSARREVVEADEGNREFEETIQLFDRIFCQVVDQAHQVYGKLLIAKEVAESRRCQI
eukprot:evm.model.scf_160EXC.5 EVM.evm.TU.scf_160EXC.5   scf_160EXC:78567-80648(+)